MGPVDNARKEREILEAIAEHGPLHVIDIARQCDAHPITIGRACARLYDCGYISSRSRGHYRLTNDGRQRLTDNHE